MSIIKSKGIEFSDVVLPEDFALDLVPFNDLSIVAGWNVARRIKYIQEIVVYHENDVVVGIELVYVLNGPHYEKSPRILHGKKTQFPETINVEDNQQERITAAFVGVYEDKIIALRFTKTNLTTGDVSTRGYIPGINSRDGEGYEPQLTWHVAYGEISAFRGTKIRGVDGPLVTLGIQTRYLGTDDKANLDKKRCLTAEFEEEFASCIRC